jgi:hypothetical protein
VSNVKEHCRTNHKPTSDVLTSLLETRTFLSAFYRGTRQSNILPSVALGKIKHSAKLALSPWHSANMVFVECRGTRQTLHSAKGGWAVMAATCRQICRVPNGQHSEFFFVFFKSIMPSDITQALNKIYYFFKQYFAECQRADTRQIFCFFKQFCRVPSH